RQREQRQQGPEPPTQERGPRHPIDEGGRHPASGQFRRKSARLAAKREKVCLGEKSTQAFRTRSPPLIDVIQSWMMATGPNIRRGEANTTRAGAAPDRAGSFPAAAARAAAERIAPGHAYRSLRGGELEGAASTLPDRGPSETMRS